MKRCVAYQMGFAMLLLILFFGLSVNSGFAQETAKITPQLESLIKEFVQSRAERGHSKLLDLKIRLVSEKVEGGRAEAVFEVERSFLLNYERPELAPGLKARIRFLKENESRLCQEQLNAVKKEIEILKNDLAEYISNPQDSFEWLKITAKVRDGSIIPGSVRIYGEDSMGHYEPISLEDIPSDEQVEKEAIKSMKKIIKDVEKSGYKGQVVSCAYSRTAAKIWALWFTSDPTEYHCGERCYCDKKCKEGDTGNVKQNTVWYDLGYPCWCRTDCANFVSQALAAGGIPMDEVGMDIKKTWWAKQHTTIPSNDNASIPWRGVIPLKDYMLKKGYLKETDRWSCWAGYPFRSTAYSHIMLMVFNNEKEQLYSAHTNDRWKYPWSGREKAEYYAINCSFIWPPPGPD